MKKEKVLSDTILKMLDSGRVKPPNWNKIQEVDFMDYMTGEGLTELNEYTNNMFK